MKKNSRLGNQTGAGRALDESAGLPQPRGGRAVTAHKAN